MFDCVAFTLIYLNPEDLQEAPFKEELFFQDCVIHARGGKQSHSFVSIFFINFFSLIVKEKKEKKYYRVEKSQYIKYLYKGLLAHSNWHNYCIISFLSTFDLALDHGEISIFNYSVLPKVKSRFQVKTETQENICIPHCSQHSLVQGRYSVKVYWTST